MLFLFCLTYTAFYNLHNLFNKNLISLIFQFLSEPFQPSLEKLGIL